MRIVVTGANGQIARALQQAAAPGAEIVCVARPSIDLRNPSSIAPALRAARPDVVINAAAYTAVDAAEKERDAAFAVNAGGAGAVAEAANALKAPLIHLSTDYVFDGRKATPYFETDAPNPLNAYGVSKLAGERAVAATTARHVIIRLSWVYGPHGANFVRTMLRLARERDEVSVVADQTGRPMATPEIAEALLGVAAKLLQPSPQFGLFHLGGEGETSWAEFAEAIFAESRQRRGPHARVRRVAAAEYGAGAERPAYSVLDGAKLDAAYGVRLAHWRAPLGDVVERLLHG